MQPYKISGMNQHRSFKILILALFLTTGYLSLVHLDNAS